MKKILSLICVGVMVFVGGVVMVGCSNEPNFSDNKVILVLTKEATDAFYDYVTEDFSEVGCIEVKDLTGESYEIYKRYKNGEEVPPNMINYQSFKRIISLTLDKESHDNVLWAIGVLEQRADVESAGVNSTGVMHGS